MRKVGLLVFVWLLACGGGDEGADGDVTGDVVADGTGEVEVAPAPVPEWHPMEELELSGFKTVRGFGCNDDWLYVDVAGNATEGLFGWEFGTEPALSQVFGGAGILEVLNSGVLVAQYGGPNQTASVVGVDPEGTATDMGFAFENTEIKAMSYPGSHLLTFSKDWATAEYMIHRSKLPDGVFEQVGPRLNQTGISLFATPEHAYVLSTLNEVLGVGCNRVPLTGTAETPFEDCPFFPQFVQQAPSDPYSIEARIYGEGDSMAAWFRVTDKGEKNWHHFVATAQQKWTEVDGIGQAEPTAWFHDGEAIYIGLSASQGKPAVWTAPADGSAAAQAIGDGLPATADQVGVHGICRAGDWLYLAWFEYNPGGSTVRIFRKGK